MIYFAGLEGGKVKIGHTSLDMRGRLWNLRREGYVVTEVLGVTFGGLLEERIAHHALRAALVFDSRRKEVFELTDEVRTYIREHAYPATESNLYFIHKCEHSKRSRMKKTLEWLRDFDGVAAKRVIE